MQIQSELIADSNLRRGSDGYEDTQIYLVTGLPVTGIGHGVRKRALEAPGVPVYGSAHPIIEGIYCLDQTARPASDSSPNQYLVTCIFRAPRAGELEAAIDPNGYGPWSIEVLGSVQEEDALFDVNGVRFQAEYTGRVWCQSPGLGLYACGKQTRLQFPIGKIKKPQLGLRFTRSEPANSEAHKQIILAYRAKTNAQAWSGFAAGTWLISEITSSPTDQGRTVDYEMWYREEGWKFTYEFSTAGMVDPDVVDGNGRETFDIYAAADFSALGLWW